MEVKMHKARKWTHNKLIRNWVSIYSSMASSLRLVPPDKFHAVWSSYLFLFVDMSNVLDISSENEPLDVQTFVKKHMEKRLESRGCFSKPQRRTSHFPKSFQIPKRFIEFDMCPYCKVELHSQLLQTVEDTRLECQMQLDEVFVRETWL
jgi:hypothetical protein